MSSWISLAIGSYILNAVGGVTDKLILSKSKGLGSPLAYAFYTALTSLLVVVLIPFGVTFLPTSVLIIALFSGATFAVALFFYFTAIEKSSVSRILPIEGGFIPVLTLLCSMLFLHERLTNVQYLAFALLVIGAVIISIKKESKQYHPVALTWSIIAAIFFALSFTSLKFVYSQSNFITGLFWTRLGLAGLPLVLLLSTKARRLIFTTAASSSTGNKWVFFTSKTISGIATILENLAISIGSVALVKALQGTQYIFLLLLTSVLSVYFPKILKEHITLPIVLQKIGAIVLISIGLGLLVI